MVISCKSLAEREVPTGFQKYLDTYFEKKVFMGEECYIAFRTPGGTDRYGKKGIAPSHSCDIRQYKEGLPAGMDFTCWLEKNSIPFGEYYKDWNDSCSGIINEDD